MLTILIARHHGYVPFRYPRIDRRPHVQSFYEHLRRDKGQPHKLAEMLAVRRSPMMKGSDRAFSEGYHNGNQFEHNPHVGDFYRRIASQHGVNVTGKRYMTQLAAFPGDPRAWVSGVDDVKAVVTERNMTCEGLVNHTPVEIDHSGENERVDQQFDPDKYQVADDIVEDELFDRCVESPGLYDDLKHHPQKLGDMKEEISRKASGTD